MSTTPEPTKRGCCPDCIGDKDWRIVPYEAATCFHDCHKTETQTPMSGELARCDFCGEVKGVSRFYASVKNKWFDDNKQGAYSTYIKYCGQCGINPSTQTPPQSEGNAYDYLASITPPLTGYVDSRTPIERERDEIILGHALTTTTHPSSETKQNGWDTEMKHYRLTEKMLNDFKNGRLSYSQFIELNWQFCTTQRNEERARVVEIAEYTVHERDCIRAQFSAGRPIEGGGYEQKFAGKWYQSLPKDKTPKCNCGLDTLLSKLKEE